MDNFFRISLHAAFRFQSISASSLSSGAISCLTRTTAKFLIRMRIVTSIRDRAYLRKLRRCSITVVDRGILTQSEIYVANRGGKEFSTTLCNISFSHTHIHAYTHTHMRALLPYLNVIKKNVYVTITC